MVVALDFLAKREEGEVMRREFELTEDELTELLDASKPVPYLIANGTSPSSPQENANRAWERLGTKHGFQSRTVQPVRDKGDRFFTADAS